MLAVAVGVLVVTAVVVSDQRFLTGEVAVVQAAADVPTWIGWPFRIVMQLGTLWVALVVVACVAVRTHHSGWTPTGAALLAVGVAYRLDNVLKDVIERPRPTGVIEGLPGREHIGGFAFPSGHTTMAVALAGALHPILPAPWRRIAWLLAATVAVTRMHVGAHWPADLVGGAALGLAIASAAWLVATAVSWSRSETNVPGR